MARPLVVVVVALVAAALSPPSGADTLIVAGNRFPVPLVERDREILAPLLAALPRLGVRIAQTEDTFTLAAPDGRTIVLSVGNRQAQVDGKGTELLAAPEKIKGRLYLPARSLAGLLGAYLRWDAKVRELAIHPKVIDVWADQHGEGSRLVICATAPLEYRVGRLSNPERIYVDLVNADIISEQRMTLDNGAVVSVRASQYSLDPDVVRVVLGLQGEVAQYQVFKQGSSVIVELPAPQASAPSRATLVKVDGFTLSRVSPRLAVLSLTVASPVQASVHTLERPDRLVLQLQGMAKQLAKLEVPAGDPLISGVAVEQKEGDAEITVGLKNPCGYSLQKVEKGINLLIGRTNLADLKIVIDPGHGGNQPGAIGLDGLREKDVNLDIARRLHDLLKQAGAAAVMTREDDSTLLPIVDRQSLGADLTARADVANNMDADIFLSIHCNSCDDKNRNRLCGTQTYYHYPESLPLAQVIQENLLAANGLQDSGVRQANFMVIRKARMPAVLVEVAYINHSREGGLLATADFRQQVAGGISTGLQAYVKQGGLLAYYQSKLVRAAAVPSGQP